MFLDEKKFSSMLSSARELLSSSEAPSFCISSLVPEKWLVEEEKDFDRAFSRAESVKSAMNRRIVRELAAASGKAYSSEGAVRVTFDFNNFQVALANENVFVFGRYEKLERGLSQSRWQCSKCQGEGCFKCHYEGKNYVSVEELIGDVFKANSGCSDYSLHASGREDVDVLNSAGRPFVLELKAPLKLRFSLEDAAAQVNSGGKVKVRGLKFVRRGFVEIAAGSHFDKEYEATVEVSRPVSAQELEKLAKTPIMLSQNTPNRVIHRRSDLERKRTVKKLEITGQPRAGNRSFRIRICAEPGTYIKEFVSGDKGRTVPSVASILGCEAKCACLDVVKIHDEFLDLAL